MTMSGTINVVLAGYYTPQRKAANGARQPVADDAAYG